MAPEQFRSSLQLSPTTDVYGIGAVLYSLLTAVAPMAFFLDGNLLANRDRREEYDRKFQVM